VENKAIQVTCRGADALPIDALLEFQGALKEISRDNLDALKRAITGRLGFFAPIFVWQDHGDNRILDGHQRLKALIELREEGYSIPLLPVAYVEAATEEEAKQKLLFITGQYGRFTEAGFSAFTFDMDLAAIKLDLRLPEFNLDLALAKAGLDARADKGDGEGTAKEKNVIIRTEIIFDNVDQQARWYTFLRNLRNLYPDAQTIAERIDSHVQETLA
jgi:hypothetical protein